MSYAAVTWLIIAAAVALPVVFCIWVSSLAAKTGEHVPYPTKEKEASAR